MRTIQLIMVSYNLPINFLIADDHQLITDGLSKILEAEKMIGEIHTAINGREAVNKVLTHDIDCAIMDINMPVLNGLEATKLIKKEKAHIKVIDKVMCDEKYISPEISCNLFTHLTDRTLNTPDNEKHLTTREIEIIRYIAEGLTNNEIADKLFLSPVTVDTHRKNMLAKLHLKKTANLVKYAAEHKLL